MCINRVASSWDRTCTFELCVAALRMAVADFQSEVVTKDVLRTELKAMLEKLEEPRDGEER